MEKLTPAAMTPAAIRRTQRWRKLAARVVVEEPLCRLNLVGCTGLSQTGDHIIPLAEAPGLAFERWNVQGACAWCNSQRRDRRISALRPAKALAFFD